MVRPGFPVPKDEIETGAGQRRWVNCTFYGATIEEVAKKRADYFDMYAPQGYDTKSDNFAHHPDGYYYVKIKRWSTCD
jgi:hypothetical protein